MVVQLVRTFLVMRDLKLDPKSRQCNFSRVLERSQGFGIRANKVVISRHDI